VDEGLRIHYRVVGTGADTVVIPMDTWWPDDIQQLASGRTLILYDPRGRGRSDPVPDSVPAGLPEELEDLDRLREHLGIGRMALIGWSYLGGVVVLYAAEHPDHVSRVIQVGPIPPRRNPYWDLWLADYAARAPPGGAMTTADPQDRSGRTADCRPALRATVIPQLGDTTVASVIADAVGCTHPNEDPAAIGHWLERMTASFGDWDWRSQAARVQAPVLTIQGTRGFPAARLLRIYGVGHYPAFERPDAFFRAVRDFLDGTWPADAERPQPRSP
jgi:pimeloyl-ACP methyl ester carboxylesterase